MMNYKPPIQMSHPSPCPNYSQHQLSTSFRSQCSVHPCSAEPGGIRTNKHRTAQPSSQITSATDTPIHLNKLLKSSNLFRVASALSTWPLTPPPPSLSMLKLANFFFF